MRNSVSKVSDMSIDDEIRHFTTKFRLTQREKEIFTCLVNGVVKFTDIARKLDVSPSTVNNHFKNIFQKTGLGSKTELLSSFILEAAERMQTCRYFKKTPKVFVVDDDPEICEIIVSGLRRRGFLVESSSDSRIVLDALKNDSYDVAISDVRMPAIDGFQLLREVRQVFRYHPAFIFLTGYPDDKELSDVLALGAVGFLPKPVNFDQLFRMTMEQFIDSNHDKNRYLRHHEKIPVHVEKRFQLSIENIGFGGVFIPLDEVTAYDNVFDAGKTISFEMNLEESEKPIFATGEIVWRREKSSADCSAGIGVKFIDISEDDQQIIRQYVRLNKILSYIPSGKRTEDNGTIL